MTCRSPRRSRHRRHRLRPRVAHFFGQIDRWARLAAIAPRLANRLLQRPAIDRLAKRMAGVSPERRIPPFAGATLHQSMRKRPPTRHDGRTVLLWPDTFNNHYHPSTGLAAVQVLEAAGFQVHVPQGALCCGRPLYEFGLLDRARRLLLRTLRRLDAEIRAGMPVIVLEPACATVFKHELVELLPHRRSG